MATVAVTLPRATPRAEAAVRAAVPVYRGLGAGFGFGALFLAGALACPALAVLAPLPSGGVRLFLGGFGTVFFAFLGCLCLLPARERLRSRLAALRFGSPVEAAVEAHGRAFVPWKSWRDYALTLKLPDGAVLQVQSPDAELHGAHPPGATVTVLCAPEQEACFCPAELGLDLRFDGDGRT